jgi:hypothetical protein
MHISSDLKLNALEDAFWQTARDAASPLEIRPSCTLSLRAWIKMGVQRMERQRRLAAARLLDDVCPLAFLATQLRYDQVRPHKAFFAKSGAPIDGAATADL